MNKGALCFFMTITGGVLGSALTWYYTKKYYEEIAQEKISSIEEKYEPKKEKTVPKKEEKDISDKSVNSKPSLETDTLNQYKNTVRENYGKYFKEKEVETVSVKDPYVIKPEDFDTIEEYRTVLLTYYSDGYLVDEFEDRIYEPEDIAATVGEDFVNHIGEYEEDIVHIRNDDCDNEDETGHDYEITADLRRYQDILEDRRN